MMGSLSIWHWLILAIVVAVLFGGRGKLSGIMGDAAKGIRAFKDGLKEDDKPATQPTVAPTGTLTADTIARNERDAAAGAQSVPRAEL